MKIINTAILKQLNLKKIKHVEKNNVNVDNPQKIIKNS